VVRIVAGEAADLALLTDHAGRTGDGDGLGIAELVKEHLAELGHCHVLVLMIERVAWHRRGQRLHRLRRFPFFAAQPVDVVAAEIAATNCTGDRQHRTQREAAPPSIGSTTLRTLCEMHCYSSPAFLPWPP